MSLAHSLDDYLNFNDAVAILNEFCATNNRVAVFDIDRTSFNATLTIKPRFDAETHVFKLAMCGLSNQQIKRILAYAAIGALKVSTAPQAPKKLQALATAMLWSLTFEYQQILKNNSVQCGFECTCQLNGDSHTAQGLSKKDAKQNAAQLAMEFISDMLECISSLSSDLSVAFPYVEDVTRNEGMPIHRQKMPRIQSPIPSISSPDYSVLLDALLKTAMPASQISYNFRPRTAAGGITYRCQLLIDTLVFTPVDSFPSEKDAKAAAAKMAWDSLLPQQSEDDQIRLTALVSPPTPQPPRVQLDSPPRSQPMITEGTRQPMQLDTDECYFSDSEDPISSYQLMVYDICDSLGLARPTFTYTICDTGSGNNSGIKCTAAIIYSHNSLWKDLPAVTCLRAHRKRRNAREDACHDMYIILQSKSGSNHMSKFRFVSDKNAGLSKDMQSEDLSVLDAGAESPVEMQL